ncbi:MAG: 4-(cytidine 5'-diphospho)-2-C-methyl-D-erythritol kinase [Firmicutes bacterium]|nr:4-(cytidine 5'-diphospho)-2-C-methyl-D-erythritol kinase [Bacillota bacterium]
MTEPLVIIAPAKINLTLKVLGKRPDGYHELETVMQQISLVDKIYLRRGDEGIRVTSNSSLVPDNEENLAWQAAQLLSVKFSLPAGLDIFIEKNIPIGAGLAGGSADAAAVLQGMSALYGLSLAPEEMLALGLALGSDVPFCLWGGTALARGRGEILTPLDSGPALEMVLVKPDFQLSTAEVYRDFSLERVQDPPDNVAFLDAWRRCDIIAVTAQMKNVLETVSVTRCPEIAAIKQQLEAAGALHTLMSGSGPTVIGVFISRAEARSAWGIMRDRYQESYLVSSYNRGD